MKRTLAVLAGVVVLAMVLSSCSQAPKEIKIGLVEPLSGGSAGPGINLQRGVQLAVDDINAKGGIKGQKVVLLSQDDESNPTKTVNAVKKLIYEDKAVIIIGSNTSSCTLAAMDVCAQAKVPQITPSSSSDEITKQGNKFIFRVTASNSTQANALVDYCVNELNLKKVGIIFASDDYGTNAKEGVMKRLQEKHSLTPVAVEAFQPKDKDFTSQLTKIKAAGADALFFLGMYDPCALAIKQAKQMDYSPQVLGLGALTNVKLVELAGDAALGLTNTQMYVPEGKTEADKAFIEKYKAKYNSLPDYYVALAYDSMMVAAKAIERAGSLDPVKIRDELAKTADFPGLGGKLTFDATGDVQRSVMIVKVAGVNPPKYEVVWPK
ncbi:MAG: ABC transporter substrate-binding protein [Firmicutes bacterium]|nr:ABC transporter substrate-binding protein [Bacillota bacterium]